ncbi:MAG: class I SAM-dependent methyltransferase [Nitrospinota bacterium]|nr:class I SAM-dependent methyltransferase [Nitrospinota bacterium]
MKTLILILGAIALLTFAGAMIWRTASRRRSLPCPQWLGWLVEMENPLSGNHSARAIIGRIGLEPGMKVLDLGCGPGRLTIPCAKAVGPSGEVTAVDMQEKMLERARAKAQAEGLGAIRFLHAGAGEGAIGRALYDRALLVTVLGEIPDRMGALKEIYQALKPGGLLSVTEIIFDPHYTKVALLRQLSAEAGFEETGYFHDWCSYIMLLKRPPDAPGMK